MKPNQTNIKQTRNKCWQDSSRRLLCVTATKRLLSKGTYLSLIEPLNFYFPTSQGTDGEETLCTFDGFAEEFSQGPYLLLLCMLWRPYKSVERVNPITTSHVLFVTGCGFKPRCKLLFAKTLKRARLRVVPHFSSEIVERAKRERA